MQELIKITDREGQQVVSARELHEFLEVGVRFDKWFQRRVAEYGFSKREDFCPLTDKSSGGRPSQDYALTIDTAKEFAMLEGNAKGKQARQYFIAREKQARQQGTTPALPENFEEAILELGKQLVEKRLEREARQLAEAKNEELTLVNQAQQQQLTLAAPKVAAHNALISSQGNILVREAAKILNYENLGQNQLFEYLRQTGVLIASENRKNEPYQCYVNRGFFRVITRTFPNGASYKADTTTYVTPAGLVYLNRRIEKAGYKPRQIKTLKQATTTIHNVSTAIKQLGGSITVNTNFLPL